MMEEDIRGGRLGNNENTFKKNRRGFIRKAMVIQ